MVRTLLGMLLIAALAACGGGSDDDEHDKTIPEPPDCEAKPDSCV